MKSLCSAGSSLKFCLVAAGEADLYPRFGRTMEWDTAAGQAVLLAAGGKVLTVDGPAPHLWQARARLRQSRLHRQRLSNPFDALTIPKEAAASVPDPMDGATPAPRLRGHSGRSESR